MSQQPETNTEADFSDNAQDADLNVSASPADSAQTSSASEVNPVTQLQRDLDEANARALRAQAELENFRKRMQRDTEQQLKFATMSLLRDILEVGDNLKRALDASTGTATAESVAQGVRMVQTQFSNVLSKHGCLPIESLGKPFDPNVHEAITQLPSAEHPAGAIMQEVRSGFMLHERVIRPSQVILSLGSGN